MLNQAWEDAFQELWNHAAHHRGLREVGEGPGHQRPDSLPHWPRTCGADVLAIASIVDAVLRDAPLTSGAYGIERRWRHCARELAGTALAEPGLEYRHNREFWSALASVIAYLSSVDAEVPDSMWRALLAEVAAAPPEHRNTAVIDEKLHLAAFSYDELWQAQKTALAKLRGADAREPGPKAMGFRMTVPRTTNADILQLATYWTSALAQVESKRREMGPHGSEALHQAGLDGEIRRWRVALADVDTYAPTGDPAAIYAKNEAFWRASASLSITIAAIDEAPPPFEMLLDTLIERRNASWWALKTPGVILEEINTTDSAVRGLDRDITDAFHAPLAGPQRAFVDQWKAFAREWNEFVDSHKNWYDRMWRGSYDKAIEARARVLAWRKQFEALGGKATAPAPIMPEDDGLPHESGWSWRSILLVAGIGAGALILLPRAIRTFRAA